jgi:hypothetical protein
MEQGADSAGVRELIGASEIAMSRNDGFESHLSGSPG